MGPYTWPQKESFISGFACRYLPTRGVSSFSNTVVGPIMNLIDVTRPSVMLFSWGIVAAVWLLLANVVGISVWNSEDGQYISDTRVLIWTSVIYFVASTTLIKSFMARGCADLELAAEDYLYARKPPIPATLL